MLQGNFKFIWDTKGGIFKILQQVADKTDTQFVRLK